MGLEIMKVPELLQLLGGVDAAREIRSKLAYPVLGYDIVGQSYIHKVCEHVPAHYSPDYNSWSEDYQVSELVTAPLLDKILCENNV